MQRSSNTSRLKLIPPAKENISLSKADALKFVGKNITRGYVLPMVVFTYQQWLKSPHKLLKEVADFQTQQPLIVRSSSHREDRVGESLAGCFESILNVENQPEIVTKSVNMVFKSYGEVLPQDQVFIQTQLQNVRLSGVLFTRDPNSGSPYYVINYDDQSSSTESITSGTCQNAKTDFIAHQAVNIEGWRQKLINCSLEMASLLDMHTLDIEFAVDENDDICIFQVRQLNIHEQLPEQQEKHLLELRCIDKKVFRLSQPHPYLLGKKTLFGVMPDWNPAEIIGTRPKPLALSLYKELITDRVWSQQRSNYGYKNVNGFPLLVVLGGTPFIDVRLSFNSFIPAQLDDKLANKLINFYLDKLEQHPHLHDKVEFEIVFSSYSFDLPQRLVELENAGFSTFEITEIKKHLLELTNKILSEDTNVWQQDIALIEILRNKQQQIESSQLNKIEKIHWLIEDCKKFGTLPFAGLARVGFIAIQMLESLVTIGVISRTDAQSFLSSINTISSKMLEDFHSQDKAVFLKKYGHLRPGTYDILSARYDEKPDQYFTWQKTPSNGEQDQSSFPISLEKLNSINCLLKEHGLKIEAIGLFNFIKKAIEAREFGKFVFSKSLSDCLVVIEQLGQRLDISKEHMAFVDLKDLLKLYSTSHSANAILRSSVALGQEYYQLAKTINLPPLISDRQEVLQFSLLNDQPNFITQNTVSGNVADSKKFDLEHSLAGKILFIESADPGYDWIFSRGISGFVTKYGGCNSHMAIRAGELNIPAVIGAGELLFEKWRQAHSLFIDCTNKKVEIIQ